MPNKDSQQQQLQMVVAKNHDQLERGTLVVSTGTTSIVEAKNKLNQVTTGENRDNWSNRVVYLLSIIGFVVDLGKHFN